MRKQIALLRGINVSGKNKIAMKDLKAEFGKLGYENAATLLNSGNIVFESAESDEKNLATAISKMIKVRFALDIPVFVITENELNDIMQNQPQWWGKGGDLYDNLIFAIPPCTAAEVCNALGEPKPKLEQIHVYKDVIFWSFSRKNYTKTNWWAKTANSQIKDSITIRTAGTVRKLLEICRK